MFNNKSDRKWFLAEWYLDAYSKRISDTHYSASSKSVDGIRDMLILFLYFIWCKATVIWTGPILALISNNILCHQEQRIVRIWISFCNYLFAL